MWGTQGLMWVGLCGRGSRWRQERHTPPRKNQMWRRLEVPTAIVLRVSLPRPLGSFLFLFCLSTRVPSHHTCHTPPHYTHSVLSPSLFTAAVPSHGRRGGGEAWASRWHDLYREEEVRRPPPHPPCTWRPSASFPRLAHASLVALRPGRTAWCGAPGPWRLVLGPSSLPPAAPFVLCRRHCPPQERHKTATPTPGAEPQATPLHLQALEPPRDGHQAFLLCGWKALGCKSRASPFAGGGGGGGGGAFVQRPSLYLPRVRAGAGTTTALSPPFTRRPH